MDYFLLQPIVEEVRALIVGERLGRAYQFGATDLALEFRGSPDRSLVISTHPSQLAFFLSVRRPKEIHGDPRTDTAFIALLKKHLDAGILRGVELAPKDRIIRLSFSVREEDGFADRVLVVALTGASANARIEIEGQIVSALRPSRPAVTGEPERKPASEMIDPSTLSIESLEEVFSGAADPSILARSRFKGFTPHYAREFSYRSRRMPIDQAWSQLLTELNRPHPTLIIYSPRDLSEMRREIGSPDFALILSPLRLTHLEGWYAERYTSPNEATDEYFQLQSSHQDFISERSRLSTAVASRLKKQRSLLSKLQAELTDFSQGELYQKYGELLLANLHQISKTDDSYLVTDFYDDRQPNLMIPAANKSTPPETAEYYFKLARKARHGREMIAKRLPQIEREIALLASQLASLEKATRGEELIELALSIGAKPAPPSHRARGGKRQPQEPVKGTRRYLSTDGYEILVGRTDRDNDLITMRIAKSADLWFHAADYPGSHVVLRNPRRQAVPPRAIIEAAQLAAKFSQARAEARVAVNYCERKFVSKPKGFAPGQVRLSSFKTILVEPQESIQRLP